MLKMLHFSCAAMALSFAAAPPATAQDATEAPAASALDTLDPEAEAALSRMGAALRAMNSFEVRADYLKEAVFPGNVKVTRGGTTNLIVQLPGNLSVDTVADRSHRRIFVNKGRMTVVGAAVHKYVVFPVNGDVPAILNTAAAEFGLNFPLRDLFLWGGPNSDMVRPTGGVRLSDAVIDGVRVGHYVFRQPGTDFQVWLEDGPQALPRRMVITNTEDPAQPEFIVSYRWNRTPAIKPDTFVFTPGPEDRLVDYGTARLPAGQ